MHESDDAVGLSKKKKAAATQQPAGGKNPGVGGTPGGVKSPGLASEPAHDHPHLIWRFTRADTGGSWGWDNFAGHAASDVLGKLCEWEKLTVSEFFNRPGNKPINPADKGFSKEAAARLDEIEACDLAVDHLWELRLTGEQRIWGFRLGSLFFFLWWDPGHTVWPAKKKHT